MAGFGGEFLFLVGLGYVLLGPQRMHVTLQKIARLKRDFDAARAQITTQLEAHCGPERGLAEPEPAAEISSPPRRTRDLLP
jgi:hypothetical protein